MASASRLAKQKTVSGTLPATKGEISATRSTGGSAALARANAHHDKAVLHVCAAGATLELIAALSVNRASMTSGRVILHAAAQSLGGAAMLAAVVVG